MGGPVVIVVPSSALLARMNASARRAAMFPPPLGPVALATYLRSKGVDAVILDAVRENLDETACAERIARLNPSRVGFSTLTHNAGYVWRTVQRLRPLLPQTPIVQGNIHAAVFRESILRQGWADAIVVGEGELPLLELARRDGADDGDVPGVARWRDGAFVDAAPTPVVQNLDDLPFPDWRLIDTPWYLRQTLPIAGEEPVLPISGSRGCRFRCSFCAQDKLVAPVRRRSVPSLLDEMERAPRDWGVRRVTFFDAVFPWSVDDGLAFCAAAIARGLPAKLGWMCTTRVDCVSPELLTQMARAGCRGIMYGFESGDDAILSAMGKNVTTRQSLETARATRRAGIPFHAFFIIGYPGETVRSALRTIRFSLALRPTTAKYHLIMPMPGSRLFTQLRSRLAIDFEDPAQTARLDDWHNWSLAGGRPIYTPDGMRPGTLVALVWLAHLIFYGRPWRLPALIRGGMSPRTLFAAGKVFLEKMMTRRRPTLLR